MVSIRADLDRCGSVHLSVTDEGSWVAPGSLSDSRGVGLALIQDVTDKLAIKHHDKGTTVLMSRRLGRDSDVVTGPVGICGAGGRTRAGEFSFRFSENPPTVALSGRIDNDCDTELEAALQRYSTAGLQSITVDLSEVTQLVATAVSVLHRFAQRSPRSTFVVRRGRPAAEILVPSGLPRLEIIDGRA
jgi:ABC-type transporter Mla MlaB component